MSMCRIVSCVVGRGCLLWSVCSFDKTLLALICFILYSKAALACYSRYLLTAYFCIAVKRTFWGVLVLEGLVGLHAAVAAKSSQSCPTLCDPIGGSPPESPIPGILQARTLEWVAISFSNAWKWKVKVKSCPTLRDPMDCSLPGSFVHGIFQARVLEWVPIAFSKDFI